MAELIPNRLLHITRWRHEIQSQGVAFCRRRNQTCAVDHAAYNHLCGTSFFFVFFRLLFRRASANDPDNLVLTEGSSSRTAEALFYFRGIAEAELLEECCAAVIFVSFPKQQKKKVSARLYTHEHSNRRAHAASYNTEGDSARARHAHSSTAAKGAVHETFAHF